MNAVCKALVSIVLGITTLQVSCITPFSENIYQKRRDFGGLQSKNTAEKNKFQREMGKLSYV